LPNSQISALFSAGATTDYGFVFSRYGCYQLNAEIWLFGNGDLRHLVPGEVSVSYSAESYRTFEAAVAALNFAGVAFVLTAVARSFLGAAVSLIALDAAALALKTIASSALFIPGNPSLWVDAGVAAGARDRVRGVAAAGSRPKEHTRACGSGLPCARTGRGEPRAGRILSGRGR